MKQRDKKISKKRLQRCNTLDWFLRHIYGLWVSLNDKVFEGVLACKFCRYHQDVNWTLILRSTIWFDTHKISNLFCDFIISGDQEPYSFSSILIGEYWYKTTEEKQLYTITYYKRKLIYLQQETISKQETCLCPLEPKCGVANVIKFTGSSPAILAS